MDKKPWKFNREESQCPEKNRFAVTSYIKNKRVEIKIKMITEIIKIDEQNLDLHSLVKAADIIKNGGLVVFPTETVYGLGANAFDANAVKKIYAAKGRPSDNPLIVHVSNPEEIYKYAEVPAVAEKIINKFMPAPLTLVLKKLNNKLDATCALDTVAIRAPKNMTARKLIELAGVPVAAPSANLSGKPSPTSAKHVIKDLTGIDMIICGENSEIGLESTVISFNPDDSLNILRAGFITREDLSGFDICDNLKDMQKPPSPGMKYKHYSPDAPLYILSGGEQAMIDFIKNEAKNKKTGFLCYGEMTGYFKGCENIIALSIGSRHNLAEQAYNLFDVLNSFNNLEADVLYSIEPEKIGVGEAVYDRLIKAAGGKIIKL